MGCNRERLAAGGKIRGRCLHKIYADSIEELAAKLGAEGLDDTATFSKTVRECNQAAAAFREANPQRKFDPSIKDGLSTQSHKPGLLLPKSNWALPLEKAPFMAVKITCGITFTFGGLCINPATAAVISKASGGDIPGLYAAGEIVGGIFYSNYPGGSGLTIGAIQANMQAKNHEIQGIVMKLCDLCSDSQFCSRNRTFSVSKRLFALVKPEV